MGNDFINPVRACQSMGWGCPSHRPVHHLSDIGIALIRNDAFRIIVQLRFTLHDMFLQMGKQFRRDSQLLLDHFVPFKQLDGVPPQASTVHFVLD